VNAPRCRASLVAMAFACLYLTALGFLVGIVAERVRFDARRAAVLGRLTTAEHQVRARLMDLEGEVGAFVHARSPLAGAAD
jgi:hypothetical protein